MSDEPKIDEVIRAALLWCVQHDGECLGDHPAQLAKAKAAIVGCGCRETYPQLVAGKVSHGPGCALKNVAPKLNPGDQAGSDAAAPSETREIPTPRTDAAECTLRSFDLARVADDTKVVYASFARQLERELAEVVAVCDVEIKQRMKLEQRSVPACCYGGKLNKLCVNQCMHFKQQLWPLIEQLQAAPSATVSSSGKVDR